MRLLTRARVTDAPRVCTSVLLILSAYNYIANVILFRSLFFARYADSSFRRNVLAARTTYMGLHLSHCASVIAARMSCSYIYLIELEGKFGHDPGTLL